MADGWAWGALGLLLLLLGIRAWVVETGHATLGRTPVKVKVLTGACAAAAVLVTGTVMADGGTRLVYLLLHPAQAQALEDAEKAANEAARQAAEAAEDAADDATQAPTAAPTAPVAGQPAPPAAPGPGGP